MDDFVLTAAPLLFVALLAIYVVFWVKTLQSVMNSDLDPSSRGMWLLAICVFQLFAPLAWWLGGPGAHSRA